VEDGLSSFNDASDGYAVNRAKIVGLAPGIRIEKRLSQSNGEPLWRLEAVDDLSFELIDVGIG
jgi:hypothetical protein